MSPSVLLQRVEVDGAIVDCRIQGVIVQDVAPGLAPREQERVIAGNGAALLPGLVDHHIHIRAAAAARISIDVTAVQDLTTLSATPGSGWLRLIGAGDGVTRARLDTAFPDRPVRAQHRSGALWTLNSAAVELLASGLDATQRESGQLWRSDDHLHRLLVDVHAWADPDVTGLVMRLAQLGVTHLTDATPGLDQDAVAQLRQEMPQHLLALGIGGTAPAPLKIMLADHEDIDLEGLAECIRSSHFAGRPVAIHAISAAGLVVTVTALADAGTWPNDRIEHAAVCDDVTADRIADLGVTVTTQPGIWARRGREYLGAVPAHERPLLWRYASLLDRGVRVVASSDAPYGDPDPWRTIQSACTRDLVDDVGGAMDERVAPETALRSMLGDPLDPSGTMRRVQPGAAADLVLLHKPLAVALESVVLDGISPVRAVWLRGQLLPAATDDEIMPIGGRR